MVCINKSFFLNSQYCSFYNFHTSKKTAIQIYIKNKSYDEPIFSTIDITKDGNISMKKKKKNKCTNVA